MNHPSPLQLLAMLGAVALVSCGDDPEMVTKREKQKAEIARLSGELTLAQEKLKNMPPDVSADLEKAKQEAEKQSTEIATLEKEISDLQTRKRALQTEFDNYRAKYQTK